MKQVLFQEKNPALLKILLNDMNTVMYEQGNLITKPATTEVASVDTPSGLGDLETARCSRERSTMLLLNVTTPAFTQAPLRNLGTGLTGGVEPKSTAIEGDGQVQVYSVVAFGG